MNENESGSWIRSCTKCGYTQPYTSFTAAFIAEEIKQPCVQCEFLKIIIPQLQKMKESFCFSYNDRSYRKCVCGKIIPYISLAVAKRDHKKKLKCESCKMKGKRSGSDNPMFGHHHSDETKKKLSELAKKRWNRENQKKCEIKRLS